MSLLFAANIIALLFSFFVVGLLLGVAFSKPLRERVVEFIRGRRDLLLARIVHNPILKPGATPWAAEAVMNPAALDLGGRIHLVYRAIGMDGVSRLGYASSPNGLVFDDRPPYPVYVAQNIRSAPGQLRRYSPILYPSGGSWGGCEDPRMVAIEGNVYVTYNLIENWNMRVGYITMSEEDFLAKRFYKWEGPYIISYGLRHKNWVLFPQKFDGKFAVLHSIIADTPEQVRVEYVDDLKTLQERTFESPDPQLVPDQAIAWHVHMRSAGPPPVKTDRGWLVLYHAHEASDPRYKLGALLLDLNDPTKVIARANAPVLSPDAWYENNGKPGIIYVCGAVVRNGMLYAYYGGADKVVCVATAPLAPFLDALVKGEDPELVSAPLRKK